MAVAPESLVVEGPKKALLTEETEFTCRSKPSEPAPHLSWKVEVAATKETRLFQGEDYQVLISDSNSA